ncbi:cilia- and flagella-associated protein 69 isoform X1 [Paramormyrops kingsleyae]|uniref:cilia- and flagella-associated protein 69 isoform X1 n=2 Tax=Paramormyrops kingsleyae TaxID=1676925 RepID=UPI003B97B92D
MLSTTVQMTKSPLRQGTKAVKHAVRDNDEQTKRVSSKLMEIRRVIELLEDPFAETLKERQLFLLKKLSKRWKYGVFLKDLAGIFKILNICALKGHPQYTQVMCDLLQICRLPFLKEKSSDELNHATTVKECFSQLGYLMRVPSTEVRIKICDSIISFYSPPPNTSYPDGFWPTSPRFKAQMVERSGLAETLVLSMALLEQQLEVKLRLLQALQLLSSSSEVNCDLILKAQGARMLCTRMLEPDPSGQLLFRSSEVLWNLLEKGCAEELSSQLSDMDCILCLKEAFLNLLLSGYRQYELQLRNDLLVIISLIAENPTAPLIESGLAKQLILFLTFPEINTQNPLLHSFKLSLNNEDFEMKKLFFNLIFVMSRDLSALQLFKDGRVLLALLHHANPNRKVERHDWSSAQQEELQLQALATLASVAPLLVDEYMTCQGNTRLLLLLEWCTETDAYFGQENSCRGAGGRGSRKAHLRYCIRLLRAMTSLANEQLNQDLCDQGAIGQLLGLMASFEKDGGEDDAMTVEIKTDILLTLSALCEEDLHRKELFGPDGVEIVTRFLKLSMANFYSGLGHNKLILSTVDAVWSCIVGCYMTEDLFLEKEGVFLLLDLLQSCPQCMQNEVLGTLLELCDNPKTLPYMSAWRRGQEGQTAAALLTHLWREEEGELGVRRHPSGMIADVKKPILSACQEDASAEPLPADRPSASVMDVTENLRSKIYSIFCRLGFENLPGLSTEDYVTLAIIRRYLDFKVGEVWEEITRKLELEGVRPVSPDGVGLQAVAEAAENVARVTASQQAELLEHQRKKDMDEEQLLYSEIRSNHKQEELIRKSWEHFVAKTSDYKILLESKKYQENCIESSKVKTEDAGSVFHSTRISGLYVTNFCGRVVTVESTPMHLTGGALAHTELALERVPIQGGAPQKLPIASQDQEILHQSQMPVE